MAATLDDPVGLIFDALRQQGAPLTVCVIAGPGSLTTMTIRESPSVAGGAAESGLLDVHPSAPIGMFVAAVWQGGGQAVFRQSQPELEYQLELV